MRVLAVAVSALLACAGAQAQTLIPPAAIQTAVQLREQALADRTGWQVVESLTTEVGPRMAGSEADARAVAWAEEKFVQLGFDRVWTEPVTFPKWERRSESARVVGAFAQPLQITALGGSPGGQIEAEDSAIFGWRGMPGHAAEAKIGERMAERRQFPVENGDDARFGWMKQHVAEAEIAMGDGNGAVVVRQVSRQPCGEVV